MLTLTAAPPPPPSRRLVAAGQGDNRPRQCQECGYRSDDVRFDPMTRRDLCNGCWLTTDPRLYTLPGPLRKRMAG